MKKNKLLFISMFFISISVLLVSMDPAFATFNKNNLISDAVFNNKISMSSNSIDNFLNKFPNSCISSNSGFQARIPSGYSPSGSFTYGAYGTAGQVIAASAQAYGINPKILIVTLEKEQSLVTGRSNSTYCSPSNDGNHKYAAAVGYGCPDGGTRYNYSGLDLYRRNGVTQTTVGPTCVNSASKAGFSQQIIRATWLLKFGQQRSLGNVNWAVITGSWDNSDDPPTSYSGPMTQGNRKRCQSCTLTYYDGYTTIDGQAVHMDTGGTAALYWYTPHFSGNQNFVNIFGGWFGSTQIENPFGKIDVVKRVPDGVQVSGWAIDPDTSNPISVHVYGGSGTVSQNNPAIATVANLARTDVGNVFPDYGSNHGYSVVLPVLANTFRVCAYAINDGSGGQHGNSRIGCTNINVSPNPLGFVDSVKRVPGGVQIKGWAIDPDTSNPISVHVYGGSGTVSQNNPAIATVANLARTDVGNVFPDYGSNHGYSVVLPVSSNTQIICVYLINDGSGGYHYNPRIRCTKI